MLFLSFDTSGRELTVALFEGGTGHNSGDTESGGKILAQERIDFGELAAHDPRLPLSAPPVGGKKTNRQESVSLLIPTIDKLLSESGRAKADIACLAVGIGPGGFTGIRVAITTARTIAQALKVPLVPVNSLELACFDLQSKTALGIIKEASRTHCYMAVYAPAESRDMEFTDVSAVVLPRYLTYEAMVEERGLAPQWYCDASALERLPQLENSKLLPPVKNIAAEQAKIAWLRVSLKGITEPAAFHYRLTEPLYLRGASVTLKKGNAIEKVESN